MTKINIHSFLHFHILRLRLFLYDFYSAVFVKLITFKIKKHAISIFVKLLKQNYRTIYKKGGRYLQSAKQLQFAKQVQFANLTGRLYESCVSNTLHFFTNEEVIKYQMLRRW